MYRLNVYIKNVRGSSCYRIHARSYNDESIGADILRLSRGRSAILARIYIRIHWDSIVGLEPARSVLVLTGKPIRMLVLATAYADIKTVGKYWLYRKPPGKCQFPGMAK